MPAGECGHTIREEWEVVPGPCCHRFFRGLPGIGRAETERTPEIRSSTFPSFCYRGLSETVSSRPE